MTTDFSSLLTFRQPILGFMYRPKPVARWKHLLRSEFSTFLAVASKSHIICIFVASKSSFCHLCLADFHPNIEYPTLPCIISLIDDLPRQENIVAGNENSDSTKEDHLSRCQSATFIRTKSVLGISNRRPLPTSFKAACTARKWADVIAR